MKIKEGCTLVWHAGIGRFQLFTLAHREMMLKIAELADGDKIALVLGSADKYRRPGNPFSAIEREVIIRPALESAGISVAFFSINDVGNYPIWANKLIYEIIDAKDIKDVIVYGGPDSSAVAACAGIGIPTVVLQHTHKGEEYEQKRLSAGHVANMICQDRPEWVECVPPEIASALMGIVADGKTGLEIIKESMISVK